MGNIRVKVHEEMFAVAKVNKIPENFFAVVDYNGLTAVVPENELNRLGERLDECERGFRLLTFEAELPFDLVGFMAKVSAALAEKGVSILVFSSYSTDHVLVRDRDLNLALNALREIGFEVSGDGVNG